jgi:hypothetical protein
MVDQASGVLVTVDIVIPHLSPLTYNLKYFLKS